MQKTETIDADGVICSAPHVRNPYNYDRDQASSATALVCTDVTRTQQQFRDECDINVILERFGVTGKLPISAQQPMQGDFSAISDFHTALQQIEASDNNFARLPAKVRDRFNNNATQFVDFCLNPANLEAVRELGLAPRPPAPPEPPKP